MASKNMQKWATGVAGTIIAGSALAAGIAGVRISGDIRVMQSQQMTMQGNIKEIGTDLKKLPKYDPAQARIDQDRQTATDTAQTSAIEALSGTTQRLVDLMAALDRRQLVVEQRIERMRNNGS